MVCVCNFVNKIYGCFGVVIFFYDEWLSMVEVCVGLFEYGGYWVLNKGSVDLVFVVVILESYFEQSF